MDSVDIPLQDGYIFMMTADNENEAEFLHLTDKDLVQNNKPGTAQ